LAELEQRYADRPVRFLHITPGENAVQALDFQKHYRSSATYLLDHTYAVETAYRATSWPTDILVDAEGNIAGRWQSILEEQDRAAAVRLLDELLPKASGGPPRGAVCVGDRCIVPPPGHFFEMQPTMTADEQGRLHLVFVRDRAGVGELYHQRLTGDTWSEPEAIGRSPVDDYAPYLCRDAKNGVRLVWCSNRAATGRYDVYTQRFDGNEWSAEEAVTQSDDDAAHPRAVFDASGNLWVTYYRWVPWGPGRSRDREVYVRYHDGSSWSEETQISPTDVPRYEDHADPSIAADAAGSVWVTWSWDTHPKAESWAFAPTFGPAVFARQLRAGRPPSRLEMVGVRAPTLQAAMNNATFAFLPEVLCREDRPWFAFEMHTIRGDHACGVTSYDPAQGFPAPAMLGANGSFVCSPRLLDDRQKNLWALWSAPVGKEQRYAIHAARPDDTGRWDKPRVVWSEPDADLRWPVATFDVDNHLWIAAVRVTPGKNAVAVRQAVQPATSQPASDNPREIGG